MRTADDQRGGSWQGVSEESRNTREKLLWREGEDGPEGMGKTLLLDCVTAPCPVLRSSTSPLFLLNCSMIIILIIMTTTMLKKYI